MRTLRFLSFGPSCSCWTSPSSVASTQRACSSAFAFIPGVRFREQAGTSRESVAEVRSGGASDAERLCVSSRRDSLSTIYGGFGVPGGLGSCQRRLHSQIASKKGKKSEKDVLVEEAKPETEVVLVEDRGENGVAEGGIEKLVGKKTKKKKKVKVPQEVVDAVAMDGGVANGHSGDGPVTKMKKERRKKSSNNLKPEEIEKDSEIGQNGARLAEKVQDPTSEPEAKGKRMLETKSRPSDIENELADPGADSENVIEDVLAAELEEHLDDDDFWEDDYEPEAELNDGGDGGGIVLGDAPWAKSVLELAEQVVAEFHGALEIFAFKVSQDSGIVRVRVDKLSDKYGSPSIDEIQLFSSSFSKLLDRAGEAKTIPNDLALEVSSPGAERVVRLPQDLERFKDLPMYVRYIDSGGEAPEEMDGVMELDSVDMEGGSAKWKLADVRLNRELAGKGRGLTRKQKDWRLDLPFETTQLVRLYIDM